MNDELFAKFSDACDAMLAATHKQKEYRKIASAWKTIRRYLDLPAHDFGGLEDLAQTIRDAAKMWNDHKTLSDFFECSLQCIATSNFYEESDFLNVSSVYFQCILPSLPAEPDTVTLEMAVSTVLQDSALHIDESWMPLLVEHMQPWWNKDSSLTLPKEPGIRYARKLIPMALHDISKKILEI